MTKPSRAKRIADLNDKFRKSLVTGGRTSMTAGVNAKGRSADGGGRGQTGFRGLRRLWGIHLGVA